MVASGTVEPIAKLRKQFQEVGPRWAIIILVLILAYMLAYNTWILVELLTSPAAEFGNKTSQPKKIKRTKIKSTRTTSTTYTIVNQNLFGQVAPAISKKAVKKTVAAPAANKNFKDTRLPLTLEGVLLNTNTEKSIALISQKKGAKGKSKAYSSGDDVPGDAVVSAIYEKYVILQRGGSFETLRFLKKKPGRKKGGSSRLVGTSRDRFTNKGNTRVGRGLDGSRKSRSAKGAIAGAIAKQNSRVAKSNIQQGLPFALPAGVRLEDLLRGKLPEDPNAVEAIKQSLVDTYNIELNESGGMTINAEMAVTAGLFGLELGDSVTHYGGYTIAEIMEDPTRYTEAAAKENSKVEFQKKDGSKSRISVPKF